MLSDEFDPIKHKMASPSNQQISFSNEDAKSSICAKAESSINAFAALVKAIIKNSHTSDYLGSALKQFAATDQQLSSTEDRITKIDEISRQLNRQSELLRNGTSEIGIIGETLEQMKLVPS